MGWYRKAADQGNAAAANNLAGMYFDGRGVRQDDVQAAGWYSKAADQGIASAQNNLAFLYAFGRGVAKDYVQAYKWYALAAATFADYANRTQAAQNRDLVAGEMTSAQIANAQQLVGEWRPAK